MTKNPHTRGRGAVLKLARSAHSISNANIVFIQPGAKCLVQKSPHFACRGATWGRFFIINGGAGMCVCPNVQLADTFDCFFAKENM